MDWRCGSSGSLHCKWKALNSNPSPTQKKKKKIRQGTAWQLNAYNPNYFGGGDQKDCSSRLDWQKVNKTPISTNKPGMMVHAYDTSFRGGCR
jgi:hypothetical protein